MDLLRAVLQSEEEEQKLCNFCIQKVYPPKPATFHCSDCEVFMCGSCSDNIHSQLEFRCHDINRATGVKDGVGDDTSTSRPSSSLSTLSQRSLGLRPGLNNRPSSSLLNYSAIPGNIFRNLTVIITPRMICYFEKWNSLFIIQQILMKSIYFHLSVKAR